MSVIKITKKEIEKIVREANDYLLEENVAQIETDPGEFKGMTYPYYGNELADATKRKFSSYEKYVTTCLQSLKMMVDQVNSDYTNDNLPELGVKYLIDDQLERLQDALNYTVSSLRAIVSNDGQKLHGAGPQYPAMMEEKE